MDGVLDQKTSQDEVALLRAELLCQRQDMQDFAYAVSHDLRAPLRHIVSFAQILQDEAHADLNAEHQEFLRNVSDASLKLGSMLDALLEFSRVGTAELEIGPVPLAVLVTEAVQQAQAARPNDVNWSIQIDAGVVVLADLALLRLAVIKLVDNAIKFTLEQDDGEVVITSSTTSLHGQTACMLTIRDNGVGCTSAACERLGKVFSRAHPGYAYPGEGVGLAVARRALQRMDGKLYVQGAPDQGFTAQISLPLAQ